VQSADVALVDFALERDGLNGVELGIALRSLNQNIGVAIYSQHEVEPLVNRVPREMRPGWSFFEKSAFMSVEDYVDILNETARGKGNWQDFEHAYSDNRANSLSLLLSLTGRQRAVMDLASAGKSSMEIAKTLDMTYAYVRKELSRIYAVLVPAATAAVDQKTAAVLRYLEIAKSSVDR
jgi:DNA-binding CsgD family transcriptional regulator